MNAFPFPLPRMLDEVRSADPVERPLEDSWTTRSGRCNRRELAVEAMAGALFLGSATALALLAPAGRPLDIPFAALLVVLYAVVSRMIRFPLGAGSVVPSYLVLVPMLLLLPPGAVPLLAGAGLVLGTLGQLAARRVGPDRVLFSIADGWHALGPALVLVLAGWVGIVHSATDLVLVYIAAFIAGCVFDLGSAALREAATLGIAPHLQLRVIAAVSLIDACIAPLGLLVADAARHDHVRVLLILPLNGLLILMSRERTAHIAQAQNRLDAVARERARLQRAVRHLGDAFAAKLDLEALTDIVLRGSIEALDADGGRLTLAGAAFEPRALEIASSPGLAPTLRAAVAAAHRRGTACQLEHEGACALALPFGFSSDAGTAHGAIAVARLDRPFRDDEVEVMQGLVLRARQAAADIVGHQVLRRQAFTDALTTLGNRGQLAADIDGLLAGASPAEPLVLMLFDLDGFKDFNDTFGHAAGDALLSRLGRKLSGAVATHGSAYRLGGDEFCALFSAPASEVGGLVASATDAMLAPGEAVTVGASVGTALIPHEAGDLDEALQLADRRMYADKRESALQNGDPGPLRVSRRRSRPRRMRSDATVR
jgi:diguanylate cyclase (GGDEF)-like protein